MYLRKLTPECRHIRRNNWCSTSAQTVRKEQYQSYLVYAQLWLTAFLIHLEQAQRRISILTLPKPEGILTNPLKVIPGHSLESFPEECAMIRDTGHEIGLHGYSHENPADMSFEQQKDVLDKTFRMLTEFCGKPPRKSTLSNIHHANFEKPRTILRTM